MDRFLLSLLFIFLVNACVDSSEQDNKENPTADSTATNQSPTETDSLQPIMLDDIHYYTLDRQKTNQFFIQNFGAKPMQGSGENPLSFIDFLQIHPEQSTINVSAQGPFPGIAVVDSSRWEREVVKPSPNLPPMYGVHWLALSTSDLAKTTEQLKANGVEFISEDFNLPNDSKAKAIAVWGPDYNRVIVLEKPAQDTPYRIDHLMILVENLDENVKFYEEVYQGEVTQENGSSVEMEMGKHRFILAEPEVLGLSKDKVLARDARKFRPNIDHIGFHYLDTRPPFEAAQRKGYQFVLTPTRLNYYEKPSAYTFAITFSPDSLQCEMYSDEFRTGPRTEVK